MSTGAGSGRPPSRGWAAAAGVVAYAAGLAVAEVVAAILAPRDTPVVAVGDVTVQLAPRWAKELAIGLFGTRDKLFLVSLVVVVALALAAVAGLLERRRRGLGAVVTVVVAIALGVAAASRPAADTLAFVPGLLAGLTAVFALPRLVRRAGDATVTPGRRAALLGGVTGAAVVVAGVATTAGSRARGVDRSRQDLVLPAPAEPAPAVPASATFDAVDGITPFRTSAEDFYRIDTAIVVPALAAGDWSLRIHGMVDREVRLRLSDILDRDQVERWVTLACVSNDVGGGLIGNALFQGVTTADLLAQAGPHRDADMVLSTSVDGFTAGTPVEALTDDRGSLLAIGMNGAPLPVEHGFPARLVVPGLYGYVSATKWVVDLEVTRFADAEAFWTVRGWTERGPIKLSSRIDRPTGRTRPDPDGTVVVAGIAWAQDVGVAAVDVRVDDGPWQPAELAAAGTSSSWRQWRYRWRPTAPGRHTLAVRVVDLDGTVQDEQLRSPFPSGSTGLHTVDLDVTAA